MQILIPVGGITKLESAVRLGALIQQTTGGSLTFLAVVNNEKTREQTEILLTEARQYMETADLPIETHIRAGEMIEAVADEVKERQIDLVVVGKQLRKKFLQRLTIPFAEQLIADVPCSVLIARGQLRPIRRALVCEGSHVPPLLNLVIDKLAMLLKHVDELTVLHVMSQIAAGPGVPGWELRAAADILIQEGTPEGTLLEEGLARLEQLNIHPEAKVRHGLVVEEILAEAQTGDYDLVAIGAHPSEGWGRYLLDDLARKIINKIDRPLLVIKR